MKVKEIKSANQLSEVLALFENGAKLLGVSYIGSTENADKNDVRSATLSFKGKAKFNLRFESVECLHVAPITSGNIYVKNVSVGQFRNIFFFCDDEYFDVTSPDTSLTYCIGQKLFIEV